MDAIKEFLSEHKKVVGIGLCSIVGAIILKKLRNRQRIRVCGVDYPADTVMLHQFSKGMYVPSLSHFVVKLEMYLRVAKIPFKPVYDQQYGPKHKIPWIEYNGVTMGDSQLIMDHLNQKLGIDLNKSLDPNQRAVAWAIQKWLEEFTYILNVQMRWDIFLDDMWGVYLPIPYPSLNWLIKPGFRKNMKKSLYVRGTGRHTNEEIFEMMTFDLQQLSTILGEKDYIMGGDEPTDVDCAAFGILSQIRWHTPDKCPGKQLMKEKLTNLMKYTDRIKERFWPDWDEKTVMGASKD